MNIAAEEFLNKWRWYLQREVIHLKVDEEVVEEKVEMAQE